MELSQNLTLSRQSLTLTIGLLSCLEPIRRSLDPSFHNVDVEAVPEPDGSRCMARRGQLH